MTTLIDRTSARVTARTATQYFYFYMALSCTAVAFLGFAPTYFVPVARGSFPPPVIHFHGLLFFAWSLYFRSRPGSLASGQVTRHRTTGMIGVSLATAMTTFGFLAAVNSMQRAAALGLKDRASLSRSSRSAASCSSRWSSSLPSPPCAGPKPTSG